MPQHLFTFSTSRNPAAMTNRNRRRFHIFLRDNDREATHYWSNLFRGTSRILISMIRDRASSAPQMPRLEQLSEQFRGYIDLYRDSHSEARRASLAGTVALALEGGLPPLQREERILLWDLLAHHLWPFPNKAIVDTIRAIFVASQLIELVRLADGDTAADDDGFMADIRRVSEARVVLPLNIENFRTTTSRTRISDRQQEMLETAHDHLLDSAELDALEGAYTEISTLSVINAAEVRQSLEEEREEAQNQIVTSLSRTLNASVLENILPVLRNNLTTAITATKVNFADLVAERTSPRTARLMRRFTPRIANYSSSIALSNLEAEINSRESEQIDAISNTYQATFLAFGAEIAVQESIPQGLAIFKVHRPPEGGFHLYLTYHHGGKLPPIEAIGGEIIANGTSQTVQEEEVEHGYPEFQTFRLTETPIVSSSFDIDLSFQSAAPDATPVSLDVFRLYSSGPIFRILNLSPFDADTVEPMPFFGINRLGIIDYRRVEQELSCYVTGEVSRIENIMASEFKERVSRSLSLIETEQMETQEVSSERQSDTETSERLEMQSQVNSVLREQSSYTFDAGLAVHSKLPGGVTLDTHADFNYNSQSSREDSTTQAIRTAKEVTRRAQEKLLQKAASSRRSLSRREFEDINKHGFDNRENPDHVVGVFRWVDKVMTNRLVNYGQLNVLEFSVPEPARNFIRAQEAVQEKDADLPRRPPRPKSIGLRGPSSITRRNWRRFAADYQVDVDPPPVRYITLARSYADSATMGENDAVVLNTERKIAYNDIEIPSDYQSEWIWVNSQSHVIQGSPTSGTPGSVEGGSSLSVSVGGDTFQSAGLFNEEGVLSPKISGTLPVSISCKRTYDFAVTVRVRCKVRARLFRAWQMETYASLMAAYRAMKEAYDDARESHLEEQNEVDLNPRFKRRHMERELKRVCIEMLTAPHQLDVTANHYDPAEDGELFKLRQSSALDRHSSIVRFFEQSFWWEIMSYTFYPYFYAERQSWNAKLTMEATRNQLFASFLSAGMARVMLPIRPGFEEAVMYYMQTGEVWFGNGFVVDSENDLYLSIADEANQRREVDEIIEDVWQTQLPTNHTILQSAAAAMIGEGLPCSEVDNRIGIGQSTLAPVLPPTQGGNQ